MLDLASYVGGQWVHGKGRSSTLVNPTTEEPVAVTSTEGISFESALTYARDVGGPALRDLTFEERGEALLALSRAIHKERDALLDLGILNGGNTRSDAKFDVDGCTGTLAYYGTLGKELGKRKVLLDGEAAQLARGPRFVGQHLLVPRRGVALHINAFNFPAWGLGEKAACALLAGMPIVVKPATSTALLAHRIAEIIVGTGALREGAFSFLCGSADNSGGSLLDALHREDVVSFTGGGSTATKLRSKEAIVVNSVRLNVEADSLNGAILGPDVGPSDESYRGFLRDVARDILQKAGQKCTAIRRIIVPDDRVDEVSEALVERLKEAVVGDPRADRVTMGPLATASQKRDIRAGIELLASESITAMPSKTEGFEGVRDGLGYFVGPTLMVQKNPDSAKYVHEHEVFGPCATVMGYRDVDHAIELTRRGGGGLVTSVYASDRDVAGRLVLGIASAHGRVVLTNDKIVEQTVGPGTVLPQSIHGGPGRAGGGEELGGVRGLAFYSQRVAVQGDRALLEAMVPKPA